MAAAAPASAGEWDRRRLLVTLAVAAAAAALLLAGLGYAVHFAISSASAPAGTAGPAPRVVPSAAHGQARRDQIAAAPMLKVSPDDARGGAQATTPGPAITIPGPTGTGPVQVPAGFPKTPEGAVGQLAAIETTVLQAMSIPHANAVYDAWALPGGAGAGSWELTGNVAAFLGRNSAAQSKAITTTVTATPAGAQVKGTDGDGWTLACVLLSVRAVITSDAQIGYGYCERMQWAGGTEGRWMIAPGTPPAHAPCTWPGTDVSIRAGWRGWAHQGPG